MRNLIFMAKTIKGNKWVIGFYKIEFDENQKMKYFIYDKNFEYEVNPNTISQYTGSRDADNRGIYEGDILLTNTTSMTVKVIVKWNEDDACFELMYENGVSYGEFKKAKVSNWHVIGNIHDTNSELSIERITSIDE